MKDSLKILIVVATKAEIVPLLEQSDSINENNSLISLQIDKRSIDVLVTGIGIAFTVYHLTKILTTNSYNLIINAGIAGSFNNAIKIGDVVVVKSDCFADFGIETNEGYKTVFEAGLIGEDSFPFANGLVYERSGISLSNLKGVKAVTVNTVSGTQLSVKRLKHKFKPDIETMEGAAFFYVCIQFDIPCIQIRSISNKVEIRDKNKWNIGLAIDNLNNELHEFILKSLID